MLKPKFAFAAMLLLAFTACSKKEDATTDDNNNSNTSSRYVILSGDMTQQPLTGSATVYTSIPSGDLNNVATGSLSLTTNGFRSYDDAWVFKRIAVGSTATADGIQRYSVAASGQLVEDKQISSGGSSNFFVYDNTTGYYTDANRGLLKIQTFNPTTMERTGEVDLSALADASFEYQIVGSSLIVGKEGKLYVDVLHGTAAGKGGFLKDPAPGYIEVAVIDIATNKYEKTIRYDGINFIGYPSNENQMWTLGDDGALYMCSHGFGATGAINGSGIIRIKKGETDFDRSWIIKADDYSKGSVMAAVAVKDGKLYTQLGSEALTFAGILTAEIYDYYVFDVNSISTPTKISGMPQTTFAFMDAQTITVIDGKVYFRVYNKTSGKNGYYVLGDNNTATEAFNITSGGQVWGFVKLSI